MVAIAGGRAFTFRYTETEELLLAAGCDVVTFDPLADRALPPETAGIYLGGGFPEVHAAGLSANTALRADLHAAIAAGIPTVAECAGLLYLCSTVDGAPMVGTLDARASMSPRLTLSYRRADAAAESLLGRPGESVTGHEFHRTRVEPGAGATPAWLVDGQPEGFATATLHASYLHTHWAGHPQLAQRFADAVHAATPHVGVAAEATTQGPVHVEPPRWPNRCAITATPRSEPGWSTSPSMCTTGHDPGGSTTPSWRAWTRSARYPSSTKAEAALARRHGRPAEEVIATAGAAEAFSVLARLRPWRKPVVIHPQFTEPDVALAEAGHPPTHVHCAPDGFALDPASVPEDADLVVVGNPTNPTGVLHAADRIRELVRPGRLVVVDEAFIDFVPGEQHSLADVAVPGLVVVRSLTKLWSIPGVRAGYVLATPDVVAELRAKQTPWSVSATAAAAMVACAGEEARTEQARRATRTVANRRVLVDGLTDLGVPTVAGQAPFVLARVGAGTHQRLRAAGYAVRRADTFPGLGPDWVRIAVRAPELTRKLLVALRIELTWSAQDGQVCGTRLRRGYARARP